MATQYINQTLKNNILRRVTEYTTEQQRKSIPGQEVKRAVKQLAAFVQKQAKLYFPESDLAVLKKYGTIHTIQNLCIMSTKDHPLSVGFYGQRSPSIDLVFDPGITIANTLNQPFLLAYINTNIRYFKIAKQAFKTIKHLDCEMNTTFTTVESILAKFRTVNSLIKAHPELKKFIPIPQQIPAETKVILNNLK